MNRNQKVSGQFGWAPELTKNMNPVADKTLAHDTVRTFVKSLENHTDLASGANKISVYSPSDNPPSASRKFTQVQRNIISGSEKSSEAEKAEKAEKRAKCSQHCKSQGRTSCSYCHGAGWAHMSKAEPSRNINQARNIMPESNASQFRKV